MKDGQTDVVIESRDFVVRYKGSVVSFLIFTAMLGIVCICVFVTDKIVIFAGLLPLSVTIYNLIGLLAAILGFRIKKE